MAADEQEPEDDSPMVITWGLEAEQDREMDESNQPAVEGGPTSRGGATWGGRMRGNIRAPDRYSS